MSLPLLALRNNSRAFSFHIVIVLLYDYVLAGAVIAYPGHELIERHGTGGEERIQLSGRKRILPDIVVQQSAQDLGVQGFHQWRWKIQSGSLHHVTIIVQRAKELVKYDNNPPVSQGGGLCL